MKYNKGEGPLEDLGHWMNEASDGKDGGLKPA